MSIFNHLYKVSYVCVVSQFEIVIDFHRINLILYDNKEMHGNFEYPLGVLKFVFKE